MNLDHRRNLSRILATQVIPAGPRGACLCGVVLGAIGGACLAIALGEASIGETFAVTACGSLLGGAAGSTIAFLSSYPRQARTFVNCTAVVFWILFLAGFLLEFWQTMMVRDGLPGLVLSAGMLYGCILFSMGGVWGLIAPGYYQRDMDEMDGQDDLDSTDVPDPQSKDEPGLP